MSDAVLLGPEALLELVQGEIDAESALLESAMDTWLAAPAVRKSVEVFIQKSLIALVKSHLLAGSTPEGTPGTFHLSVEGVAQQIAASNVRVAASFSEDQVIYAVRKVAAEAGYSDKHLLLGHIRVAPADDAPEGEE